MTQNKLNSNVKIFLTCGLLALKCFGHEFFYPPSKFIGFYDEYLGFQNGQLLGEDHTFTGSWMWVKNGKTLLTGHYTDGIPSGEWKEFSDTEIIRRHCVYTNNGAFVETVYHPDGKPRLKITGTSFFQPERVYRQIDSIQRLDGNPQKTPFPEYRIAPCSSFTRSHYDESSEGYLTFQTNLFQFSVFQYDFDFSQWHCDVMTGTLDWEKQTIDFQQQPSPFLFTLSMNGGDLSSLHVARSTGVYFVDKPKGSAAWTRDDFDWRKDVQRPVLYVTERHTLTDMEFTNVDTGHREKIPFQIVVSGFYLPGHGWSDIHIEPAGPVSYSIPHKSLFAEYEKPFELGTTLYFDYWGNNNNQYNKPDDIFAQDISIMYGIVIGSNPLEKQFPWSRRLKTEYKTISMEKYRAIQNMEW